jgi:hypothetical protein
VLSTQCNLRATAKGLGRSPDRFGAIIAHDVKPVFVSLDTGLDIVHGAFAVIAATVTEVRGARRVPHWRKCAIDTKRISILHQILEMRVI